MSKYIKRFFRNKRRIQTTIFLSLLITYTSLQAWVLKQPAYNPFLVQTQEQTSTPALEDNDPKKKVVRLVQASLQTKRPDSDYDILIDSVILYHDGAYMYCDSAYINQTTNTFEAFGMVRVEQGDTLFLYGKHLEYDGNTRFLKIRHEVRLLNTKDDVTLFTDSLDYDRVRDIGYYFDGGMLVDSLNELTSYWGQYEPSKHLALFHDSVILTNPKFLMYTDSLYYRTDTKIADIIGFTTIESDSATIYSTRGWYNTETEESLLLDQSRIVNIEGNRSLIGDSIFYDKRKGFGEVFGNMYLIDTLQKVILKGDYGFYNELTENALATKRAQAIEYSQGDSLFIHADTLKLNTDSIYKLIKGYYGVRFFRTDLQGVCDSLQFSDRDSILHLYRDPVLWNENNQISGDTITVYFNDSTIDWAHVRPNAFAIQNIDSTHYNQVKGRVLKAYFENKDIKNVLVEGNAESIFYPEEKDKTMIGMNKTESSYLSMDIKERKIQRIKLWPKSVGKMVPIPDIVSGQDKLDRFEWYDYLRPLDKDDIFRDVKKKGSDNAKGRRSNRKTEAEKPQEVETPAVVPDSEVKDVSAEEVKSESESETNQQQEPIEEISAETDKVEDNSIDIEVVEVERVESEVFSEPESEFETNIQSEPIEEISIKTEEVDSNAAGIEIIEVEAVEPEIETELQQESIEEVSVETEEVESKVELDADDSQVMVWKVPVEAGNVEEEELDSDIQYELIQKILVEIEEIEEKGLDMDSESEVEAEFEIDTSIQHEFIQKAPIKIAEKEEEELIEIEEPATARES